jgi:DNA-binding MarR family transcriptional regulator
MTAVHASLTGCPQSQFFAQCHKVAALFDRRADQVLQEHCDLTFSQFRVLWFLQTAPEACQADMAAQYGLSNPAISRQVVLLHKRGLVTAATSRGRRQSVSLTPAGKKLFEKARQALQVHIYNHLPASLDVAALAEPLASVTEFLRQELNS